MSIECAVRQWATELEDRECRRSGASLSIARRSVARRLNVAPGTLENLRRKRIKGVRAWLAERIRRALVRELEFEIARLTHELEMVRQSGLDPRSVEVGEIETHLAKVRALLS